MIYRHFYCPPETEEIPVETERVIAESVPQPHDDVPDGGTEDVDFYEW